MMLTLAPWRADSSKFGTRLSGSVAEEGAALEKGTPAELRAGAVLRIGLHLTLRCAARPRAPGLQRRPRAALRRF